MRKFVLIGVALVAALGTAFLISSWLKSQQRPVVVEQKVTKPKPQQTPRILVAELDLPAGTIIQKDHLRWQPWPKAGITDVYVVKKPGGNKQKDAKDPLEDYLGAVVRRGIAKGEPITARRVVRQGERGFLAAILTPGMRAVSVPINAASGVSGLLFPGDRVDVILTHAIGKDKGSKKSRRASETVLRHVRLLAVDQRTNDQNNKPVVAKTATLEVTPKQAEALTMITDLGRLSLSLVSLAKEQDDLMLVNYEPDQPVVPVMALDSYTLDNEVSALLKPPPTQSANKRRKMRVVRGRDVQSLMFNDRATSVEGSSVEGESELQKWFRELMPPAPPPPQQPPEVVQPPEPGEDDDDDIALIRAAE